MRSGNEEGRRPLNRNEGRTFAAAFTSRIRLGTSVIVLSNHELLPLARRLATLDVLSGGRLICGLGIGWSKDEIEAARVHFESRGRRADEFIQAMKKIWTEDPVEFEGQFLSHPEIIHRTETCPEASSANHLRRLRWKNI